MNKLSLRPYQAKIAGAIIRTLQSDVVKIPVMGMATGTGKTITAYEVIRKFLCKNPGSRVLVLTHNQVALRRNFQAKGVLETFELTPDADLSSIKKYRVVVGIPATVTPRLKKLGAFRLVVVDEAHEHWAAPRVQGILRQLRSPKQLLLTASHSCFPNRQYKKYLYSVLDGFNDGILPKVGFHLLGAHLDIDLDDYNDNDDLAESVSFEDDQVRDICEELSQRLLTLGNGTTPKTMVICHSVAMACAVYSGLKDSQIANIDISISIKSHLEPHLADPDSSNLERFRKRPNPRVLVVAQRGVLGFDCAELEVVIDLSGTRNIERTRQHVGRLLRRHPKGRLKSFLKVVPHDMEYYGLYLLGAVVALMHPENDAVFEGDPKSIRIAKNTENRVTVTKPSRIKWWRQESIMVDCPVLDPEEYCARMPARRGATGRLLWDVAYTDLEEVREFERGDLAAKTARLIEYAKTGRPRPRATAEDQEERVLGRHLTRLQHNSCRETHQPVLDQLRALRSEWFDSAASAKALLHHFAQDKSKLLPKIDDKLKENRALRRAFDHHVKVDGKRFDADIRQKLLVSRPDWFFTSAKDRQDLILSLAAKKNGGNVCSDLDTATQQTLLRICDPQSKLFDQTAYALVEAHLPDLLKGPIYRAKQEIYLLAKRGETRPHHLIPGQLETARTLVELTSPGPNFDPEFNRAIRTMRGDWFVFGNKTGRSKDIILAIAREPNSKRPSQASLDPEEVRIAQSLQSYTERSRFRFDHNFAATLRELRPDWFRVETKRLSVNEQLLMRAESTAQRPRPTATNTQEALLGRALNRIAVRGHRQYDAAFHQQLVNERPDWFVPEQNKEYWALRWPLTPKDHEWFRNSCLAASSPWYDGSMAKELAMEPTPPHSC